MAEQFNQFDANNDERLDSAELAKACNIARWKAKKFIKLYDANGDGMLDAQEFEQLKLQILNNEPIQKITTAITANDEHNQFDANNDGRLDANELANACAISVEEAQSMIAQYDVDGDGMLDAEEFEQLKQQILEQQRQRMTNTMAANDGYNQFDADDDGRIDANELAQACSITLVEAQNIIAQYDVDGDGMLDPQEFEQLKQQILDQQRQNMTNNISFNDEHNQFDADDDGRLDANELAQACNITVLEAQNIIDQYDVDGDGMLDPQEFEQLKQQILDQQRQNMTNNISYNDEHNQFDADDDGRLDANELAQACDIDVLEAQNIIAQYDVDGDGMLDAQEFEQLKQQILDQQRQNMTEKITYDQHHNQFDADNDGKLDANELAQACNISVLEAQNIIAQYDVDGDGKLDPQEFEQLKQQILEQQRQEMTNKMGANNEYNQMDANNDNKVDAAELAQTCNVSIAQAQAIIAQYDVDGDGKLDRQEFEEMKDSIMQQQRAKAANAFNNNTSYNPWDEDDDNKISAEELAKACNISVHEAKLLIQQNDTDGDGFLDAQEFDRLKQQILSDQRRIEEEKQTAPYQTRGFSGDIQKVDEEEYNPHNSNARAFGVDIFEANKPKSSPFGQANKPRRKDSADKFGRKPARKNSADLFGRAAPKYNNNRSPFGQNNANAQASNASPFGSGPGPKQVPESAVKVDHGTRYKHKWALFISYDPQRDEITLKVEDNVTKGVWFKTVNKQEHYGNIKEEYFRIGGLINDGNAKYKYQSNGAVVQVSLSKGTNRYDFNAQPV